MDKKGFTRRGREILAKVVEGIDLRVRLGLDVNALGLLPTFFCYILLGFRL